jgi:hypothetical protein
MIGGEGRTFINRQFSEFLAIRAGSLKLRSGNDLEMI